MGRSCTTCDRKYNRPEKLVQMTAIYKASIHGDSRFLSDNYSLLVFFYCTTLNDVFPMTQLSSILGVLCERVCVYKTQDKSESWSKRGTGWLH